jgi:hypothetical protein
MQQIRTPQQSIRLAVVWLAVFAVMAGVLAATFGPQVS